MTETDAYEEFKKIALGPVHEGDFGRALHNAATGLVMPYDRAVPLALEQMKEWYQAGDDFMVLLQWEDLAKFVSARQPAAVWCVFLRKAHRDAEQVTVVSIKIQSTGELVSDSPVQYFWFEAQTGILRDKPPAVSNYHQYKFHKRYLAKVQLVLNKSDGVGIYQKEDLDWLWENQELETKAVP